MTTYTTTNFRLHDEDRPSVTPHADCVSVHMPGFTNEGRGFALTFTRAHLQTARRLLAALEALPALPRESDADPFTETRP